MPLPSRPRSPKLDIVDTGRRAASSTSFTNQLTKAKEAGATLIFAPIYYTPASVLLKNAKDMGYDMTLMGTDGMDGLLSVEGFDTLAEGVLLMTPFSADDEKNASSSRHIRTPTTRRLTSLPPMPMTASMRLSRLSIRQTSTSRPTAPTLPAILPRPCARSRSRA